MLNILLIYLNYTSRGIWKSRFHIELFCCLLCSCSSTGAHEQPPMILRLIWGIMGYCTSTGASWVILQLEHLCNLQWNCLIWSIMGYCGSYETPPLLPLLQWLTWSTFFTSCVMSHRWSPLPYVIICISRKVPRIHRYLNTITSVILLYVIMKIGIQQWKVHIGKHTSTLYNIHINKRCWIFQLSQEEDAPRWVSVRDETFGQETHQGKCLNGLEKGSWFKELQLLFPFLNKPWLPLSFSRCCMIHMNTVLMIIIKVIII